MVDEAGDHGLAGPVNGVIGRRGVAFCHCADAGDPAVRSHQRAVGDDLPVLEGDDACVGDRDRAACQRAAWKLEVDREGVGGLGLDIVRVVGGRVAELDRVRVAPAGEDAALRGELPHGELPVLLGHRNGLATDRAGHRDQVRVVPLVEGGVAAVGGDRDLVGPGEDEVRAAVGAIARDGHEARGVAHDAVVDASLRTERATHELGAGGKRVAGDADDELAGGSARGLVARFGAPAGSVGGKEDQVVPGVVSHGAVADGCSGAARSQDLRAVRAPLGVGVFARLAAHPAGIAPVGPDAHDVAGPVLVYGGVGDRTAVRGPGRGVLEPLLRIGGEAPRRPVGQIHDPDAPSGGESQLRPVS